jgi:hypothetical protein
VGQVVSIRGSVVDVEFEGVPPPMRTLLKAGKKEEILIEILISIPTEFGESR